MLDEIWEFVCVILVPAGFLLGIAVLILGSIFGISLLTQDIVVGEGQQRGYITAIETDRPLGLWQTRTVYVKTSLDSTQEETYCILDIGLYDRLKLISPNQQVVFSFNNYFFNNPSAYHCSAGSVITSFEDINK